jgi:hypothetical protein
MTRPESTMPWPFVSAAEVSIPAVVVRGVGHGYEHRSEAAEA